LSSNFRKISFINFPAPALQHCFIFYHDRQIFLLPRVESKISLQKFNEISQNFVQLAIRNFGNFREIRNKLFCEISFSEISSISLVSSIQLRKFLWFYIYCTFSCLTVIKLKKKRNLVLFKHIYEEYAFIRTKIIYVFFNCFKTYL
jgi:hypothetical protein